MRGWLRESRSRGEGTSCGRELTNYPSVTQAKGDVSGRFAEDVVSVGQLTVTNQTFCAARRQSEDFDSGPTSGLLGLAFGSIAVSRKPTFFENLLEQKRLDQAAFSVYMTRKKEQGSEVSRGSRTAARCRVLADTWLH